MVIDLAYEKFIIITALFRSCYLILQWHGISRIGFVNFPHTSYDQSIAKHLFCHIYAVTSEVPLILIDFVLILKLFDRRF